MKKILLPALCYIILHAAACCGVDEPKLTVLLWLPHCVNKTCIMADAEGHNNFYRETWLCNECKRTLNMRGVAAR
ncbi:hypothetical protein BEL04_23455 [Mucilaginibacter sp. PPCGB 2223]|uniref:hypothetical protein n=1 Tax=Mucilaginibacter sp. PPCGB 2223 TaxID=1886027 RepID=UPI000827111A|nr:hypothetical protein [Mucilaginibacter sp. PPCGB 2223]OCX50269.1 hypothetical protein BEL04_23455 [Mucilaginibacter sp. PPCGB 2223]